MKMLISMGIMYLVSFTVSPKVLTIGIDMSKSSPVFEQNFANVAAGAVAKKIQSLKKGDFVIIRKLGETGLSNIIKEGDKKQISKRFKQKKAAKHFHHIISSFPEKKDEAQSNTNIIAWLNQTELFCEKGGDVILLTDALEASVYISVSELLDGTKFLPQPKSPFLKGCSISFFGLGLATNLKVSPVQIDTLKNKWIGWMKEAGTNNFKVIINP